MIAKLSLLNRRLIVETSAADVKTLFKEIGLMAEVFEADCACGSCGSENIRPAVKTIDGYDYYSLRCTACGAELSIGQRKDGGLFAKRKDDQGNWLDDGGWRKFKAGRAIEASTAPVHERKGA